MRVRSRSCDDAVTISIVPRFLSEEEIAKGQVPLDVSDSDVDIDSEEEVVDIEDVGEEKKRSEEEDEEDDDDESEDETDEERVLRKLDECMIIWDQMFHMTSQFDVERMGTSRKTFLLHERATGQTFVAKCGIGMHEVPTEVRVLHKLKNVPGVVHCERFYALDNEVYVALLEYLRNDPYNVFWDDPELVRKYCHQTLSTLARVHEKDVVLRDVKVGNILWDHYAELITFIDFDLSADTEEECEGVGGTDGYVAPEVDETEMATKQSDVYSLGVVFSCIHHKTVYPEDANLDVHKKRRKDKRTNVLHPFHDMVARMLRSNPEQRPTAAELLNHCYFRGYQE